MIKPFRLVINFFLKSKQHKSTFFGEEEVAAEHFWGCMLINVALFVRGMAKRRGIQRRLMGPHIWKQNGEVSLSNNFQLLPLWFPE